MMQAVLDKAEVALSEVDLVTTLNAARDDNAHFEQLERLMTAVCGCCNPDRGKCDENTRDKICQLIRPALLSTWCALLAALCA